MSEEDTPLVLVIDDTPENLQVVYYNLEQIQYRVTVADSGKKGLERAEATQPDLILLDIMMPGMDGYEVCRKLKENPKTATIPVIFLTAKTETEDIIQAFQNGGVDYITKPFNINELVARVKTHVMLKRSREALANANASKDKLFSIISHDTKAVLSGVISLTEMTLRTMEEAKKEEIEDDLDSILGTSKKLYEMLENLLDWATVQSGTMNFRPESISLFEMAEMVYDLFQSKCQSKDIEIINQIQEDQFAFADYTMVMTLLRNLVSNAIKFSNPGGKVRLRAHKEGDMVAISVVDEGVGIAEDIQEKLFNIDEAFTIPGTHREEGSGLGLILCKELAARHNGSISIESTPTQGATFTFTLPLEAAQLRIS